MIMGEQFRRLSFHHELSIQRPGVKKKLLTRLVSYSENQNKTGSGLKPITGDSALLEIQDRAAMKTRPGSRCNLMFVEQ